MKTLLFSILMLLVISTAAFAQTGPNPGVVPAATNTAAPKFPEQPPADPFQARLIPINAKVYIGTAEAEDTQKNQAQGFENYLAAALRKKNVPVLIVADASIADFAIVDTADAKGAGFAKKWLLGDFRRTTTASIEVVNLRTGVVAYADSSHRSSANRGLRSSAEKLAKYLKKKI